MKNKASNTIIKISVFFSLSLCLITSMVYILFASVNQMAENREILNTNLIDLKELNQLVGENKVANASYLKYLITYKKRHINPYRRNRESHKNQLNSSSDKNLNHKLLNLFEKSYKNYDDIISARDIDFNSSIQGLLNTKNKKIERDIQKEIQNIRETLQKEIKASEKKLKTSSGFAKSFLRVTLFSFIFLIGLCFIVIFVDQKKRTKYERALQEAENKARQHSNNKSQFLAHISHEIRTPLNTIYGIPQYFDDLDLNPDIRKLVKVLQSSTEQLLQVVNNVLDLSKIESGHLEVESVETNLQKLTEDVARIFSLQCQSKGITLAVVNEVPKEFKISTDLMKLKQVLINIIGNSIKFTSSGQVELKLTHDNFKSLTFKISDTGIGIAPENIDKIFSEYQQAESSTTRNYGGTGLGLPLSKKIVEALGGTLRVSSEVGIGTTFSFSFTTPLYSSSKDTTKSKSPILSTPFFTALVVDDIQENRDLIKLFFKKQSCKILEACNGKEALEILQTEEVDIVFMDSQMPVMDGKTTTQKIRDLEKSGKRKAISIIKLSAQSFDVEELSPLYNCSLPKPIIKADLFRITNEVLHERTEKRLHSA